MEAVPVAARLSGPRKGRGSVVGWLTTPVGAPTFGSAKVVRACDVVDAVPVVARPSASGRSGRGEVGRLTGTPSILLIEARGIRISP